MVIEVAHPTKNGCMLTNFALQKQSVSKWLTTFMLLLANQLQNH
jgi:hypothetical protein